ncbi:MAG: CBS domain-containing protein [Candidatus Latescibacterota bacterium]
MNITTVKELMIPREDYATVDQNATLREAIIALEVAQEKRHHSRYRHRAVLVKNERDRIVGKLSMLDVLRALDPKFGDVKDSEHQKRFGFDSSFIQSTRHKYDLWSMPLDDLCLKAANIVVKNIMYTPRLGEYVMVDTSLNEAVHQLVSGSHQSLLVINEERRVVGVLRLTDVFARICDMIKPCT